MILASHTAGSTQFGVARQAARWSRSQRMLAIVAVHLVMYAGAAMLMR
jgi:hypothetical protein